MQRHHQSGSLATDDVRHELILQIASMDRDERFDDPTVRVGDDEVREALVSPFDGRKSRDEELPPSLQDMRRRFNGGRRQYRDPTRHLDSKREPVDRRW